MIRESWNESGLQHFESITSEFECRLFQLKFAHVLPKYEVDIRSVTKCNIEGIVPAVCTNKMIDLQDTKLLRLFGLTNVHWKCSYALMYLPVSLCPAETVFLHRGVTYMSLFYVVTSNIYDYANKLIWPSGGLISMLCAYRQNGNR